MATAAETDPILSGGGEMGALMRSIDWSTTPLGPVGGWPQSLRTTVSTCLNSRFPILIWWGPDHVKIYNDAYRPMLGDKHPRAMGQPGRDCWPEIWHIIGPMLEGVLREGRATWSENQFLPLERHGFAEECYFTFSYSPIRDESGGIGGVFSAVSETTRQILGERRLSTLRGLAARAAEAKQVEEACWLSAEELARNTADLPFALLYLIDRDGKQARLVASTGVASGTELAQTPVDLVDTDRGGWPLERAMAGNEPVKVDDLDRRFAGPEAEALPARAALMLPFVLPGDVRASGVLVAGVSPHLALDEGYQSFLKLVAGHVATAVASARAFEEARKRAEALAEIDRAKTAFFNNVSHEFRTPLTLMLGPLEDALAGSARALAGDSLDVTYRNALRLLKLVNTLLDFSRIEAGRIQASYQPVDLAKVTTDLVSVFRSAVERGGLRLLSRCEPIPSDVYVDRDMWEKIVLNLLSNAFKFTFEGEIEVKLEQVHGDVDEVRLTVRDTGIGVSPEEMPRLFERFHRIEGARARTHEGSGIGLALVQDLVRLHGGRIRVDSEPGKGTTFTVTVPTGSAHLPAERVVAARPDLNAAARASAFVEEALRWTPDVYGSSGSSGSSERPPRESSEPTLHPDARILVADDNADLRDYLTRILGAHWRVETAADGALALEAARREPPDLIVSDVMMPGLNGFALLREIRNDPRTLSIPVIMLSARAGEEARVEGLDAGANDYLIKPFSARELVARVTSQLAISAGARERAQLLGEAEAANRAKDEFLAMLGHELRNPLSPMLTALELMRLRGTRSPEQEILERQVQHLIRLVDDLLDISRVTRGKIELRRENVELADTVVRALEMASPLLEQRQQQVDVRVPRRGLGVNADPGRVSQIVSNLLTNAAKYSEVGSRIVVEGRREGDRVCIRVEDQGIGIAPDMLVRVFDLFVQHPQTLDRSQGGLGLGLAIVRSLVELHGGTVRAGSEGLGKGSVFVVELPAVEIPLHAIESRVGETTAPRASRLASKRILIVDDNEDAAETLKESLEELGYVVEVAHDGPAALGVVESFGPDVALVDIGLPVMDGYELARRLRTLRGASRAIRLVAITGYGRDADRRRSAEAGFDRHLVKPVDLDSVEHEVEELTS